MPRKLDNDTRMHFRTFDDETHAQKRAFCLHCNKDACADNIQRMKNHLLKCDVYLSSTANNNQVATNAATAAAANGAGAPPRSMNEPVFSVQMEDAPMGPVLGNGNGLHPMTTTHPQLVPRPQQQNNNQQQQQQQQQSPANGSTSVAPNGRTIAPSNPPASQQPTSIPPTPTSSAPTNIPVAIAPAPPGSAPGPGATASIQQAQQPQSPTPNLKSAQTSLDKVRQAMSRSTKRLDNLEAVLKTQVQDGMHNAATHVRAALRDERDRLFKLSQTLVKQEMRVREAQNPMGSF